VVVVVNYGIGNLGSIANMLRRIGIEVAVASETGPVAAADRLILPGVGAFDAAMERLLASGLVETIRRRVLEDGVPLLGICLGMQLLTERSEEGGLPGLGWVPADTVRFRFPEDDEDRRIPHMGWNTVSVRRGDSLFRHTSADARFYFVHSYHVRCRSESDILATTHYGREFVAAFGHGNVFGTQFHPEKSHTFGMEVLRAFCEP
jgi:glutamine amidotransferase